VVVDQPQRDACMFCHALHSKTALAVPRNLIPARIEDTFTRFKFSHR